VKKKEWGGTLRVPFSKRGHPALPPQLLRVEKMKKKDMTENNVVPFILQTKRRGGSLQQPDLQQENGGGQVPGEEISHIEEKELRRIGERWSISVAPHNNPAWRMRQVPFHTVVYEARKLERRWSGHGENQMNALLFGLHTTDAHQK